MNDQRQDAVISGPRSMRSAGVREARRGMLDEPHIKPLADYVRGLRETYDAEFPEFDPADGGTTASIVFLFEKPGPMTSSAKGGRAGSGFISRDNDDPTAEATFNFMIEAGIPRKRTVLWNIIPGWNGTRNITKDELDAGTREVLNLIAKLPKAKAIVLVGKKAQRAEGLLRGRGLAIYHSPHPSRLVRASWPDRWRSIPACWAQAAATCSDN